MTERAHRRLNAIDVDVARGPERAIHEQFALEVGMHAERIDVDLHALARRGRGERREDRRALRRGAGEEGRVGHVARPRRAGFDPLADEVDLSLRERLRAHRHRVAVVGSVHERQHRLLEQQTAVGLEGDDAPQSVAKGRAIRRLLTPTRLSYATSGLSTRLPLADAEADTWHPETAHEGVRTERLDAARSFPWDRRSLAAADRRTRDRSPHAVDDHEGQCRNRRQCSMAYGIRVVGTIGRCRRSRPWAI